MSVFVWESELVSECVSMCVWEDECESELVSVCACVWEREWVTRTSKKSFVELYISLATVNKKKIGIFKEESSYGHHHPSSLVQKKGVFKEESSYGHHHPSMLSGAYFKYLDMASITFVLVVLCALMTAYKEKNQNSPDQKQFYTFMEKLLRM